MDTVALRLKFIPLIILSHFVFIYRVYIFRLYNSFERVYIRVYISWKFGFPGIGIELEAKTKTHGVILFSKVVAIRRIVRRELYAIYSTLVIRNFYKCRAHYGTPSRIRISPCLHLSLSPFSTPKNVVTPLPFESLSSSLQPICQVKREEVARLEKPIMTFHGSLRHTWITRSRLGSPE